MNFRQVKHCGEGAQGGSKGRVGAPLWQQVFVPVEFGLAPDAPATFVPPCSTFTSLDPASALTAPEARVHRRPAVPGCLLSSMFLDLCTPESIIESPKEGETGVRGAWNAARLQSKV